MCGMTNTTGSGEDAMDMTVGRINQLTGQTSQSTMASGYPKIPTCSTGYCTCITKDAEIKRLTDEVALLKRTDRESRDEWLKSWGFGLFAVLKHGPIGEVLALLQDGWISRGKAAEAMAEIMLGNTPNLPERKSSAFDDLEIPCDVVNELRRCAFELSNDKDMALGKLDQALGAISAAIRREEVLREALKRVKGIISPYSVANHHIDDALSVSPAAKDPQNSRIVELESALNRLRAMAQCYGVTEKWTRQEVLETCHRALRGDNDQTIAALSACDEGRK